MRWRQWAIRGYFSRRRVLDLAGLVSPRVLDFHRGRTPAEAFDSVLTELAPDYLVLRSFEVDDDRSFHGGPLFVDAAARERFEASYEEAERFSAPWPKAWGGFGHLTVYRRR